MIRSLLLLGALGSAAYAAGGAVPTDGADIDPARSALLAAVLLCCSAFFSGSETALFSLQPLDRRSLSDAGHSSVERLLARPRRTLASLLIGNELVNLSITTVTAGLVFKLVPGRPWVNVLVVAPLLLLAGEVLPKTLALRFNRRVAPLVAPVIHVVSVVAAPLRVLLTRVAELSLRLTGGSTVPRESALREEHLRDLLDQGRRSGTLRPMEQEVIDKVFEFGELNVGRLMTPRPDMFSLPIDRPWPRLIDAIRDAGYSRVPIWEGSPDNVIGILVVKDLLPMLVQSASGAEISATPRQIRKLLRPAHFVPTTKHAEDLLDEFRARKFHLSLVVDEHGSVVGLVTLDDLLGELVGELLDETDVEEPLVQPQADGSYLVKAYMDVEDFADRFGLEVPEGEYNTVGGFVIAELGDLPKEGDNVRWNGVHITVCKVEGRRATDLRVETRLAEPAEPTPPPPEDGPSAPEVEP